MKANSPTSPLVSCELLADQLGDPSVVCIDASWYLPAMQRDGKAEYLAGHIPGSVFFDIDEIADHSTDLPHMMPSPEAFAAAAGALGIDADMTAVIYDGAGLFSAPRVWWMLRTFGMERAYVLDGGLPAWRSLGMQLEAGAVGRAPRQFEVRFNESAVIDAAGVALALAQSSAQVVDARAAARFKGDAPEPRPGLPSGHMAGALNLPVGDMVVEGRLASPEKLLQSFAQAGFDPQQPTITSCGSGVSAAIINLAMETTGNPPPRLYDGSWTEWASRGRPIATG